ncbi:MAG: hypothetical protein HY835_00290, partial [Anaerolineae bacterium]|nr:hypothetical protein [Anaerolineae bacterium]
MLALIPSTLLLLTALVIFILRRVRRGVGVAWVVGSLGTLLTFAISLFLRWRLPQEAAFSAWLPFSVFTDSPIFGLDNTTWPYLFALAAVGLVVLLSASARLNANSPLAWMGVLTLLSMGMLAVLSANLLTLILTWTLIDLLELVILQANSGERSLGVQTVIAFAVRVSGTALVMVSALLARGAGVAPTFSGLPPTAGLLILLAAGLRLGVLPLHLAELRTVIQRRGLGTVLRMVAAASALAVLGRLPGDVVAPNVAPALLAFTSLAVLYAAAMWAASADEISGRPFWLIALSGMAVAGVVQGVPQSGLGWGVVLILAGSLLFLFSARRRPILFIPLLALLALTGLPFTPASSGWTGLLASPFKFWQIPLLIAHALLLFGYTRFVFAPGEDLTRMERWIQAMYP